MRTTPMQDTPLRVSIPVTHPIHSAYMIEIIKEYFPEMTPQQESQMQDLDALYRDWNAKINVISRRDINNLYVRHVLHSLAIAKFWNGTLVPGTSILDIGTGGGFPGIPLSIMFPQCHFHLLDRIAKKIRVVNAVAESLGLKNVTAQQGDIGECHERFDYAVSRGVMRLEPLVTAIKHNISKENKNTYTNGLVCLKGGDLSDESAEVKFPVITYPLNEYFDAENPEVREAFADKYLVYVPMAAK